MSIPADEPRRPASSRVGEAEALWVSRARTGDRRAFGVLYRRFHRLVHGIVLSRAPLPDVPDLVQDVFTRALDRLGTLEPGMPFGPWIAAIARHRAIDHLRTRRDPQPWLDDTVATPALDPRALEALQMILALPSTYRETMVLRLVEGMSGPQIAARTGLTPGSVRVKLHRGMKLLRQRLDEDSP